MRSAPRFRMYRNGISGGVAIRILGGVSATIALLLIFFEWSVPLAAMTCQQAQRVVEEAVRTGDTERVRDAWLEAQPADVCIKADVVKAVETKAASLFAKAANESLAAGRLEAAEALVAQAGALIKVRSFDLDLVSGEIAHRRRDFDAAAKFYQFLMSKIDELPPAERPSGEVRDLIFRRAVEARQLATTFVPAPRGRGNKVSGVFARISVEATSGVTITALPLPIQFEFNQDRMNQQGLAAARELCAYLGETANPNILIVGHTDDVGSVAFNDHLSKRRADAVASFLVDNKCVPRFPPTDGRGMREPLKLSDPTYYTNKNEIDRLNRRVELVTR